MVATVLVGMLCAHLLFFSLMFLLISRRLQGQRMGMDLFALGNLLLGVAYLLQLAEGSPGWGLMSAINHTLTLASPVAYWLAAMRFFGRPVPLWHPLLAFAAAYGLAQLLVQWSLGTAARHALLSGTAALIFLAMVVTVLHGVRTFAKDLRGEMLFFAVLIYACAGRLIGRGGQREEPASRRSADQTNPGIFGPPESDTQSSAGADAGAYQPAYRCASCAFLFTSRRCTLVA